MRLRYRWDEGIDGRRLPAWRWRWDFLAPNRPSHLNGNISRV